MDDALGGQVYNQMQMIDAHFLCDMWGSQYNRGVICKIRNWFLADNFRKFYHVPFWGCGQSGLMPQQLLYLPERSPHFFAPDSQLKIGGAAIFPGADCHQSSTSLCQIVK